jgi:hypothetical protein
MLEDPMLFNLVQALTETRSLATEHAGDPAWDALAVRVDAVIDQLTEDAHDPTTPAIGSQRLVRREIDTEDAQLAAAALAAVHDRPDEQRLELATAAIEKLDEALS